MIALAKLNPKWIGQLRKDSGEGLTFDCPACGPSHQLAVYFSNPRDRLPPMPYLLKAGGPTSWRLIGDDFDSLTITPSVQYQCWHGWVELGFAIGVDEATHRGQAPDGQVISLSPWQVLQLRAQGAIR